MNMRSLRFIAFNTAHFLMVEKSIFKIAAVFMFDIQRIIKSIIWLY